MASNSGAPAAAGASGPGVVVAVRRELNDADMGPAGRSRDRYATTHDLNEAQLTDADMGAGRSAERYVTTHDLNEAPHRVVARHLAEMEKQHTVTVLETLAKAWKCEIETLAMAAAAAAVRQDS